MQSQARNIPSIADQPQNISADGATEHLAAWASAAMRACATFWRCVALAHAIDHLNAMTDGQLAECNLSRQDIVPATCTRMLAENNTQARAIARKG